MSKTDFTVALVGNPNCGKTSLFNQLTGARQRTGNMAGVTVDIKQGQRAHQGVTLTFVDLPGLYSLSQNRVEERVARDYLLNSPPDFVLNVLDASNLSRHLALTTQLLEQGLPTLLALNMMDEAARLRRVPDLRLLCRQLGVPVLASDGRKSSAVVPLLDQLVASLLASHQHMASLLSTCSALHIDYEPHIEQAIKQLTDAGLPRWQAVQSLEAEGDVGFELTNVEQQTLADALKMLAERHDETATELITAGRYGYIHGLCHEIDEAHVDISWIDSWLDGITLNRWLGLPLFFLSLWLIFEATFTLGAYPADWIEQGVSLVADGITFILPDTLFRSVITDGLLAGVGGVLVFLPNVVLLFLFIAILEQSGYMARAAFLTDRVMSKVGLHGKAFVPLVMGFGCNVPAIMATRTIEEPRARLITILINPFMSCSARLPVYVLLAGIFFADNAGTALFGIHMLGIMVAFLIAALLSRWLPKQADEIFIMELPPWRWPSWRSLMLHVWDKVKDFLHKVGGVILVGSMAVWILQTFPMDGGASWLEQLGRWMTPVFAPLGFSWHETVALLSGFLAKEVIAATLAMVYQANAADIGGLRVAIEASLVPAAGLALMVFSLLYMPCLATLAVIRRETGSWRWAALSIFTGLVLAWSGAWLAFRVGSLFL
ncbi:ferrous iron transport protein B [Neptunomonas antarctica]|uniref:Ferrous iron transport protein B n=1 Tax=Neptunomonas antarctica TaxID=619304 RepID=A0A1N7MFV6_9GAMM|nr:ferrous iron transport protein B [Neptunomonas antarctica]SIS84922.1 ferrous iron transport protein B [Neptunomonas antarctica]